MINILIFFVMFVFIDIENENTGESFTPINECTSKNILLIFSNNIIAITPYLVPVIGAGKFLLDIYLTVSSIKEFLLNNSFETFLILFAPHVLIEFYAMTICCFISWKLINDFLFSFITKINFKEYIYLLILPTILLFVAAVIEVSERCMVFD